MTFEVIEPPVDPALMFWALQVSFVKGSETVGAGHMGLQHHTGYPGNGAVNWGGYLDRGVGGGEIPGSVSALGSSMGNANTFDFAWQAGRRYRYWIHRSPVEGWRATLFDVDAKREVTVRDLHVDADAISHPMVWTEAFADCSAPSCAVRWSDFAGKAIDGSVVRPASVRVNYQRIDDGGCTNTNTILDGPGITQRTNTERTTPQSTTLPVT